MKPKGVEGGNNLKKGGMGSESKPKPKPKPKPTPPPEPTLPPTIPIEEEIMNIEMPIE